MTVISWVKRVFESKTQAAVTARELKPIDDQLVFAASKPLTIGVEFELALLDAQSLKPAHRAVEIVDQLKNPLLHKELFEHMLEVTTPICQDAHEVCLNLGKALAQVQNHIAADDLLLCGTGQPPTIYLADCRRVPDPRYAVLRERRKILIDRFGKLGMHIHLGMSDAESCVRYSNFFMHFIPHLLALSAGSPFEEGINTGLASIRPTITESLPVAGMPYFSATWRDFRDLCHAMYRAGSIQNLKDLWWDIRPCPRYGTMEIRICDQPSTLAEAMAIIAFVHALALWFSEHQSWLEEMPRPSAWRARENKWRAMRYSLDAKLVLNKQGDLRPIAEDIAMWLERLEPIIRQRQYEPYIETLRAMLAQGGSAARQQQVWDATQSLEAVTRFCCDELKSGRPQWQQAAAMRAPDEADEPDGAQAASSAA